MTTKAVDVAIIGASLAGASTALRLASHGVSVALFDQSTFPRRKACGEGLSIQGMEELKGLGLEEQLLALPHVPFYGFRFFERRKVSQIVLRPHMHGVGVKRVDLDNLLVEAAGRNGVELNLGKQVSVERIPTEPFLIECEGRLWRARYVVLATGAHSALPQTLGVPTFFKSRSRCGLSIPLLHKQPHNQTTVDIFVEPKIQACSTPVDPHTTTLSLFCANDLASRLTPARIPRLVEEVCERLQVEPALNEPGRTVSGLGRVYRTSYHNNVFVVGDAYRQLDPIGGMGMTQALVTGRITGDTLFELYSRRASDFDALVSAHEVKVQRAVRKLVGYTLLTYWSLSTPLGRETLGRQKVGALAREVLLSMHRPSSPYTPYGLISSFLIQSAGLW